MSDAPPPPAPQGAHDHAERELTALLRSPILQCKLRETSLVRRFLRGPQDTRVSVVMPTWNRAHVIRRAIDSVLRQQYANFELLISDDGSDDETEALVRGRYAGEDRILYLRSAHRGVSHARNVALERSSGTIIAYLDSDNAWSESFLLIMLNRLSETPEADAAYCGIQVCDTMGHTETVRLREYDREALLARNYIDMNVFMHRRSLWERLGGFDDQLAGLEDWDLILRYTQARAPLVVRCCLATYYIEDGLNRLTVTEDLQRQYTAIRQRYRAP